MKKKVLTVLSGFVLLVLSGCQQSNNEQVKSLNDSKIQVVTTFYPVYEFTKEIVGDSGEITNLISGQVEAHDYEPSAKDIAKIQEADVFVYSSAEMETWVPAVLKTLDMDQTRIVKLSQDIELMETSQEDDDEAHEAHEGEVEHQHELDPHIWLSPILAKKQVQTLAENLIAVDSTHQEEYEKNLAAFTKELDELDYEFKTALLPAKNKTFVTQHAAFGYLAKEYGLTQEAIAGLTPDAEPSAKQLAALEDFVNNHQIEYLYVEKNGSSKLADTIASATGVQVETLSTLETGDVNVTYLQMMRENLASLTKAIH